MKITALVIFLSIIIIIPSVFADDLALINIKSKAEAELVSSILSAGKMREGNKFLVSLTDSDKELLADSGVSYEISLPDVDPQVVNVIFKEHNDGHIDRDFKRTNLFQLTDNIILSTSTAKALSTQLQIDEFT